MNRVTVAITLCTVLLLPACSGNNTGTQASSNPQTGGGAGEQPDLDNGTPNNPDASAPFIPFPEYVSPAGVVNCSVDDIKRRVDWDMRDYYIYYDQVPKLNLADYASADKLIRALRVAPDSYSSVRDAEQQSNLADNGLTNGFGLWFLPAKDGVVRFKEIRGGSPAERAGLLRGDELISLDGRLISSFTEQQVDPIFAEENSPVSMTVRTGDEAPRSVSVEYDQYRWITAGPTWLFSSSSNPDLPSVGYLSIRAFLETTKDEIDRGFEYLEERGGAGELIVDLRYNGGGRTRVARYLGAKVGGAAVAGKVITETRWNDKYSSVMDSSEIFETVSKPLNLPRVFVLTTGRTSSASEIFINSLRPYIEVVVIGDKTSGKPFTSNSREYCGKSINAMRSVRTNSVGVSVSGGIQPDCYVADDWQTPLQSTSDPLVLDALRYITNGSCSESVDALLTQRSAYKRAQGAGPRFQPDDPSLYVAD